MGQPKQLLPYHGKSLLQQAIQVATETTGKSIVVLGAYAERLIEDSTIPGVEITINEAWEEGMASSIRTGLTKSMASFPGATAVIFMVCDQPFVTAQLLQELILKHHETGLPIAASRYQNSMGTPALFHKSIFAELLKLEGDAGAKKIIRAHQGAVGAVDFPFGNIDIDNIADYEKLLRPDLVN